MPRRWEELSPVTRGLWAGIAAVAVLATALSVVFFSFEIAHPSAVLFRDLIQVGIGVFVAFAIAMAAARLRVGEPLSRHLYWLGEACGVGIAGFAAIGISVALAAYREGGHASAFDLLGLSWAVAALLLMGFSVAALPYAVFSWEKPVAD